MGGGARMKKPNITPGEWYAIDYAGYINIQDKPHYDNHCDVLNIDDHKEAHANADFICKCKSIFEKGYRIEAIEEMYEALERSLKWIEYAGITSKSKDNTINQLKQALKNAKYEE